MAMYEKGATDRQADRQTARERDNKNAVDDEKDNGVTSCLS